MLFPLTLYICLLGLAWAFWRRREILDRNEVLFGYLLSIGGTWTAVLISLIPSQEYASAYGQQVLMFSSCGAIIFGAVGILVYALGPMPSKQLSPSQEVKLLEAKPAIAPQAEPSLQVKIYESVQVRKDGSPFKRIFFQVTNVGESTAPFAAQLSDCRIRFHLTCVL